MFFFMDGASPLLVGDAGAGTTVVVLLAVVVGELVAVDFAGTPNTEPTPPVPVPAPMPAPPVADAPSPVVMSPMLLQKSSMPAMSVNEGGSAVETKSAQVFTGPSKLSGLQLVLL